MRTEFEYASKGAGTIHAYRWAPEGTPIAVLQLVHGIAEHMLRYDEFARYLNGHGVLVVAEDHMGHGRSVGSGAERYFAGGWLSAVGDTYELLRRTKEEFPDLPYFVLGHSMGSFMTRTLLFTYPNAGLRGAVICGTGWQSGATLAAGRTLCALEQLRLGETKPSPLLNNLMFGAFNRKFPDAKTENDWICADPAVVRVYTDDPLCGGSASVGLAREMLRGIGMIEKKKNLAAMPKELPVLFIAGKSDPVGNMGKGVKRSAQAFRDVGMRSVELKLYDGRHEILNERNRGEVYDDVWRFLEKNL